MKIYRPMIEDSLELCNADGELIKEVPFKINVNEMYKILTAKWGKVSAQASVDDKDKMMEVTKDLCNTAFGKDVIKEVLDFFGDDESAYASLLACYVEKVYPLMIRLRMENIEQRKKLNRYAETDNAD